MGRNGWDGRLAHGHAGLTSEVTQILEVGIPARQDSGASEPRRAGRPVELAWVSGNNARTKERIEIYRQGQLIEVINTPLARTEAGVRYSVRWRPRAGESRRLRFCVRSTDAAGGEWPVSCARVLVLGESV